MINPGLGELKLTLECCGEAQPLADVAMNNINLNQYTEPIEEKVKRDFVGKGKCSALEAKQANVTKGKAKCTYLYDYADKNWQKYKYSAYCVPSDVLSNFAGPQSTIMGYVTVERGMNRNAGELVYTARGFISWCYNAMNQVNEANDTFSQVIPTFVEVGGQRVDTGYKEQFGFPGLGRLTVMDMFQRSVPVAFTGVLYVFRNDFWVSSQEALNITHFDWEQMNHGPKTWNELSNIAAPLPGSLQAEAVASLYSKIGKDLAPMMGKPLSAQKQAELVTAAAKKEEKQDAHKNPEWKKIWVKAECAKAAYNKNVNPNFSGDFDPAAAQAAVAAFSACNGDQMPPGGATIDPAAVKEIYDTVVNNPGLSANETATAVAKIIANPAKLTGRDARIAKKVNKQSLAEATPPAVENPPAENPQAATDEQNLEIDQLAKVVQSAPPATGQMQALSALKALKAKASADGSASGTEASGLLSSLGAKSIPAAVSATPPAPTLPASAEMEAPEPPQPAAAEAAPATQIPLLKMPKAQGFGLLGKLKAKHNPAAAAPPTPPAPTSAETEAPKPPQPAAPSMSKIVAAMKAKAPNAPAAATTLATKDVEEPITAAMARDAKTSKEVPEISSDDKVKAAKDLKALKEKRAKAAKHKAEAVAAPAAPAAPAAAAPEATDEETEPSAKLQEAAAEHPELREALLKMKAMHNQFPGQDVDKLIAKLPDALAAEGAEDAPKETVI